MIFVSGIVVADKEVKVFKPFKSFVDKGVGKGVYKRVIADDIDEDDIKLFKNKGCFVNHRLMRSASFNCPENVVLKLNVREARIFHIADLEADYQIDADKVWAEGIKGTGVDVVILDTGIDSSHIELNDSIKGQKDFVNNDDVAEDDNGHGTHVAGIITANGVYQVDGSYATGVAPGAGIYMLKVCDASGSCYEDDIMAAMEYAVNNLNAKIMSLSIGGGNFNDHCDSDPLAEKVNWVVDNGFTVVVAAGNEGKGVSSPACASKAVAVGTIDKSGVVPYWSNRGIALDIIAPGVDVLSTYSCLAAGDCGSYWYAYMSGTSMSTPHIAGVIALLLGTDSTLTDNEIKNALYTTAEPATKCYECARWSGWSGRCIRQKEVACTSEIQGAGVVNAYEAYSAVKPSEPDSDSDGIPDSQDACPDTYGDYCHGCPEPACLGCQSPSCPATGEPVCVDDDLLCISPNAVGTCFESACSFECLSGYDNCNGDWNDGCEADWYTDSNNCGSCGNTCGTITCPASGCGVGDCGIEYYGYYPLEQQTSCVDTVCSGECTATCSYDATCDPDDDSDGVLDADDACPITYGTDCNGCTNPCSGCAVMSCDTGTLNPPTCMAGSCSGTTCQADGCGVGTCAENEYGTYTSTSNACEVVDGIGACTNNPCTLNCVYSSECETPTTKCWSAEYTYLKRSNNHFKKFCKCAEGNYGYKSYSYARGRQTAYQYVDAGDNENWETKSTSTYYPAYKVKCSDGNWYDTNQDYYFG